MRRRAATLCALRERDLQAFVLPFVMSAKLNTFLDNTVVLGGFPVAGEKGQNPWGGSRRLCQCMFTVFYSSSMRTVLDNSLAASIMLAPLPYLLYVRALHAPKSTVC